MDLDKAIKSRHSVRRFKTTKQANWRKVIQAIDSSRLAPLAGNIPTTKFILVTEPEKIAELADAAMQPFIADANYVVVVCSDKKQVKKSYDERADKYVSQQAGSAIENFLLKITDLGLASCWIGAFSDEVVKKILNIPDDVEVEAIFPVGYELGSQKQKPKTALDNILYFNKYENKYMKPLKKPEAL